MIEPLLMITMNPPRPGQIVNVDGIRYHVRRLLTWTGTVARLEIEQVETAHETAHEPPEPGL